MYHIPAVRVALIRERSVPSPCRVIRSPEDAAWVLREAIGNYDRETFAILLLDAKNWVVAVHIASVGGLDSAPVHPREIFKAAILANARAVILGHNHPSVTRSQARRTFALQANWRKRDGSSTSACWTTSSSEIKTT